MPDPRRLLKVVAAVVLLDAGVTFSNWWPTPAIWWHGAPSVELAIVLLALVAFVPRRRPAGRQPATASCLVRGLSIGWMVLILGRYIDVTAPALWGRELNFYWDLRFLPDVAAMLLAPSRRALLVAVAAAVVLALAAALLYRVVRWAWRQVLSAVADGPAGRLALGTVSAGAVLLFAMQVAGLFGVDLLGEEWRLFPRPVTQVYARQAKLTVQALTRSAVLPPSPSFDASLTGVADADVFLFFIESYGAVTFDSPVFDARLQEPRRQLAAAVTDTGRDVVSAFVESPTFGGSSWFAHISFLSGLEVADPDTNALLMTEHRPTLVTNFADRGYRTVAMMPGLWYPWPEGAFYGFQDIYDGPRLDYRGPPFGWWDMPDQFTLAALDARELSQPSRPPLFAFYPTVSTHTPFSPVPPYQPDWTKMLTPTPFSAEALDRAYVGEPDYMNLGPGYAEAVAYAYQTLAGYVRQRAAHDYVMVLIGDHQPPALVSGEHASWDVPVHVITNRAALIDGLVARGFTRGLVPHRPHLGKMHALTPLLLDTFSSRAPAAAAMPAR